jgi:uncharacterized protein (DUF488 family)
MIYTFGHSTLELAEAEDVLAEVGLLIDVRSHPTSNHVPQWRKERLEEFFGDRYAWEPRLGGWAEHLGLHPDYAHDAIEHGVDIDAYLTGAFPKHRIGRKRTSTSGPLAPTWTNQGLYDYSWFMVQPCFREGIEALLALEAGHGTVAIMCAELLWWKCHRSMIADALCYRDIEVWHFQPRLAPHDASNRLDRYEPEILQVWERWLP